MAVRIDHVQVHVQVQVQVQERSRLVEGLWYGFGGSFVTGNAMSSELDFNTSAVAVPQVPARAPLEWYSDVGRKSKSLLHHCGTAHASTRTLSQKPLANRARISGVPNIGDFLQRDEE